MNRHFAIALLCSSACVAPAAGDLLPYFDRIAFEAAAGAVTVEDFESIDIQQVPEIGGTIATAGFDIVVDANHGSIGIIESNDFGSRAFMGDVHGPGVDVPFFTRFLFPNPLTAFGADFNDIDEGGILDVEIGGQSFSLPNGTTFFGVVATSDLSFSDVELRTTGSIAEFYEVDNVAFGIIPEPGTLILALLAASIVSQGTRRYPI